MPSWLERSAGSRWPTARLEIGWAGAGSMPDRDDAARDECRILEPGDPDRKVEAVLHDVDEAVAGVDLDLDCGMPRLEAHDGRRKAMDRKADRSRDA